MSGIGTEIAPMGREYTFSKTFFIGDAWGNLNLLHISVAISSNALSVST